MPVYASDWLTCIDTLRARPMAQATSVDGLRTAYANYLDTALHRYASSGPAARATLTPSRA